MASKSREANAPTGQDVDIGAPPDDLTGAVLSGVLWKSMSRGVTLATRIVVIAVLARILTPGDYGVAGMALVVMSFAAIFTDPALGAALIQRPEIDERDRSTVFWTATGIGATLTVLSIAFSPLVARFFGEPEVRNLFAVASLVLVVTSLSVAHRALLTRQLAYRGLEIRETVSIVTGGVVAICVALAGFGPWAIVSNALAYSVMSTVLAWLLLDWRPRAVYSRASIRRLGAFSSRIFGAMMLAWGNQNLDNALIGRVLGAAALGAYALAYNTMMLPVGLVAGTLHQALTPAYSRIQHDKERLERVWLHNKRLSVAIVAPALMCLAVVAPDFVHVLVGDQWGAAVVPLQILCVGAVATSLGALNWSVLQARGEGKALLRLQVLSSAVTWIAFVAGLPWGIVGVAAFYAAARWLLVVPAAWFTARGVSFDFGATLRAGTAMIPLALGAALVALGTRELLVEAGVPPVLRLVAVGLVMAVAYIGLVRLVIPSLVEEILQIARRRGRSEAARRAPTDRPVAG
jgi:O-antigen/teichoic acid export membrane protein